VNIYGVNVTAVKRVKDTRNREREPKIHHTAVEVCADHASIAIRLACQAAARKFRTPYSLVDTTHLRLIRTVDWKKSRVLKIH
jgi:hypothetical protein